MAADIGDSYESYQQSVRGRASSTYYRLRKDLENGPSIPLSRGRHRSLEDEEPRPRRSSPGRGSSLNRTPRNRSPGSRSPGSRSPAGSAWEQPRYNERSDFTYGAAVERLKSTLQLYEDERSQPKPAGPGIVHFSERSLPRTMPLFHPAPAAPRPADLPSAQEVLPLLQNQAALVNQLEATNSYNKEELAVLSLKVKELGEENRLLHEELKRSVIHEILAEGIDVPGIPKSGLLLDDPVDPSDPTGATGVKGRTDYAKWQKELERLSMLHTAKASRLETQLQHTREELTKTERAYEDVRVRLRTVESSHAGDVVSAGGLCVRCGAAEAVLPHSVTASQKASIDRVTRERDELLEQLSKLKVRYNEVKTKEEDAYLQVKRAVEMVENAQLEQTQALVQREQLKAELENMRMRMADHVDDMTRKMGEERELARQETKAERQELNEKIKELTASLVEVQTQLERVTRDKTALLAEVEEARQQIDVYGFDYGKATDSMKVSMTQATLERNKAVDSMARLRSQVETLERDGEKDKERLRVELAALRRRLGQAEKELVDAKEEAVSMTHTMQALERETHLAKLSRETVEKSRSEDVKRVMQRAETREAELNSIIDQLEQRNASVTGELEDLVNSQGTLVHKLRAECKQLAHQLEDQTHKYKRDNKRLAGRNKVLMGRLAGAQQQLRALEDQHSQQGALHERMRDRLKHMDSHATNAGTQIVELLGKESSLMRDRLVLAREVEFLRGQLSANRVDQDRFYSAHSVAVNDIIANVQWEQRDQRDADANQELFSNRTNDAANGSTAPPGSGRSQPQSGRSQPHYGANQDEDLNLDLGDDEESLSALDDNYLE